MAQPVEDPFINLERHRQLLEDNIAKLRSSLLHWRTWEAEYEGLKEEIQAAKPPPSREQLVTIGQSYQSELLKKSEIDDIIGVKTTRTAEQVVNVLQRRIDYVAQNVQTLQKQLEAAEQKRNAASVLRDSDVVMTEEGLPLTEILEELDADGNVLSSHTTTPGSQKGQLLDVLRQAGVTDLPDGTKISPEDEKKNAASTADISVAHPKPSPPSVAATKIKTTPAASLPPRTKKGVKFTEDTKSGPEIEKSKTAKRLEDIIELSKQRPTGVPVIPAGESDVEAALRQELLQYSLAEVGNVVAELDLEEGSEFEDDDDYDDESNSDDGTSSDDDDEHGKSKSKIVNEKMRRRMLELEEKLGVRMMENAGPRGDISPSRSEDEENASNRKKRDSPPAVVSDTQGQKTEKKKGVRFAEELDIQEDPELTPDTNEKAKATSVSSRPPISDVIERVTPVQISSPAVASPHQTVSKFNASRAAKQSLQPSSQSSLPQPQIQARSPNLSWNRPLPTGPPGKVLADGVIEKHVLDTQGVSEPDAFEPALLQQEVATEYHRVRNRMIQREGGFVGKTEEEEEYLPFTEEEGGPKKVSRFKAARLGMKRA